MFVATETGILRQKTQMYNSIYFIYKLSVFLFFPLMRSGWFARSVMIYSFLMKRWLDLLLK